MIFLVIFFAWSLVYILPKEIPSTFEYYGEMNAIHELTGDELAFYKVLGIIFKSSNGESIFFIIDIEYP